MREEKTIYTQNRIDEMKFVSWVTQKFNESKSNKAGREKLDNECIDAYNRTSSSENTPEWGSNHTSNYIFSTIESIRPILTDNNPQFQVLARKKSALPHSDAVQMALDYEWNRTGMKIKLPKVVLTALQIGTGIIYLKWNKAEEEIEPIIVDPRKIYPDPLATNFDDAQYVIYADWMHINELKSNYPSRAHEIHGTTMSDNEFIVTPLAVPQRNMALVLEMWLKDNTYIDVEEVLGDGTKKTTKRKKYPYGRVITVLPQCGIVLGDKHNPYVDGKFPFVAIKDYDVPFEFWGKGDVEQLLSPQKYMDRLNNAILDNAKHTANTIWIVDKNSGIPKGALKNREGLVIRKNPGTEVTRPTPPSMPSYVQYKVEEMKADIENIAGIHDVSKGKAGGGVIAAQAIMALQEAGQARIRLKVAVLESALSDLGNMWLSRMKQFWPKDKIATVANEKGQINTITVTKEMLNNKYDIIVTAGSTMPLNKNALLDMMIRLAQTPAEDGLPMADREAVLEFMPISSRRGLIERFEERKKSQEDQIAEQYQQQMEQMSQVMQELVKEVQSISKELEKEKREKEEMKQFEKGYQAGQNGEELTQEQKYGIIQNEKKIPDEILDDINNLSDEEMAELLKVVPNLGEILEANA